MEPRRDDGDDAHSRLAPSHRRVRAAMEPRRDDGDDATLLRLLAGLLRPQWSPVVTTGTTARPVPLGLALFPPQWSPVVTTGTTRPSGWAVPVPVVPQWSPVVTTGTTLKRRPAGGNLELAAMEPRRDDGDDPALLRPAVVDAVAAMEPRRDDGDDNTTEPRDRR